jgi:hypothetical protein
MGPPKALFLKCNKLLSIDTGAPMNRCNFITQDFLVLLHNKEKYFKNKNWFPIQVYMKVSKKGKEPSSMGQG